ncbi:endoplasmic reticulum-resident kdel protein [Penicillium frequentans]|nr:endoplasmic reticulum-resident kdel protein [Penicillium glabrum]
MLLPKLSLKARLTLLAVFSFVFLLIVGRLYRVTDYPLSIITGDSKSDVPKPQPNEESTIIYQDPTILKSYDDPNAVPHPIDHLIRDADTKWADLRAKQVYNLTQVAEQYRQRRGRHPPPGFDKWYEFAKSKRLSSSKICLINFTMT